MTTLHIVTVRTTGKSPMVHIMGIYDDDLKAQHRQSVVETEVMALGTNGSDYQKEIYGFGCVIGTTTLDLNSDQICPFEEIAKKILNNEVVIN
jgi:hypothetical protein